MNTSHLRFLYNEILLDRRPFKAWEPELSELIEAVFTVPSASVAAQNFARAAHLALTDKLGAHGLAVPLLSYNFSAASNPFTLVRSAMPERGYD